MIVGRVTEIWRYPVKSMAGGRLPDCRVTERGIPGDRGWALRDEEAREIRGGKKFPALLRCKARYVDEPGDGATPTAEITLPDGTRVYSDDPETSRRLSALLGAPVTLWPIRPPDDLEHYRRRLPGDPAALDRVLREMFGRLPDEPLPDLTAFPRELIEFTSPRGTYFDAFPLHLLTDAWLDDLARTNPGARFDRRRFRPNLLIAAEPGQSGKVELAWCGREARVGEARIKLEMPAVRCSMTTQPQDDLPKDPSVLRTIVRASAQNVGVYASVIESGTVRVGDPIELS